MTIEATYCGSSASGDDRGVSTTARRRNLEGTGGPTSMLAPVPSSSGGVSSGLAGRCSEAVVLQVVSNSSAYHR